MAKLKRPITFAKVACSLSAMAFILAGAFAAEAEKLSDPGFEKAQQAVRLKDYSLAAKLFNELAEQGNAAAQYQLGALYQTGRGVSKDDAAALRWYSLSEKNGYSKATERLKEIEQKKTALKRNTDLSKEELLLAAVTRGDRNEVGQLLRAGADIDHPDAAGRTSLMEAVDQRNVELVGYLLKSGAKPDLMSKDGDGALVLASRKGDKEITRALLDSGASLDIADAHGLTPLMVAVQKSDLELVRFFTQHGCDVRSANRAGHNALDMALTKGDREIADVLTAAGAAPTPDKDKNAETFKSRLSVLEKERAVPGVKGQEQWTPLIYAVWRGETDMVKYLAAQKENINAVMPDGKTALSCAASRGSMDIVDVLLKNGAKPWLGREGVTPLELAAENGHEFVARRLLEEYAVDASASPILVRAMSLAVKNGHGPVVKVLLDKGADLPLLKEKATPLFLSAAQKGDMDLLRILMDRGVLADVQGFRGRSALMAAAEVGKTAMVEYLLSHGANIERADIEGHTALALAARAGNAETVAVLVKAGALLNSRSEDGNTPLLLASDGGHRETIEMLLKAGARIELSNRKGFTALAVAVKNNDLETTKILLEHGANPYISLRIVDTAAPAVRDLLQHHRGPKDLLLKIVESFYDS